MADDGADLLVRIITDPGQVRQEAQKVQSEFSKIAKTEQAYRTESAIRSSMRESQAAARRLYEFSGNPFLVVSSLTSSISGIKKIKDNLDAASQMMRKGSEDAAHYNRQLDRMANIPVADRDRQYYENRRLYNAELEKSNALINRGMSLEQRMIRQTKGAGFAARSIVDFGLQQLATGAMFTFAFQGAALVMQTLGAAAVQFGRDLIDPLNRARDMAREMVDIIKSAGGPERFGLLFGLNEEEVSKLKALAATGGIQTATEQGMKQEELQAEAERRGVSPAYLMIEEEAKKLASARIGRSEVGQQDAGLLMNIAGATAVIGAIVAAVATGGLALPAIAGLAGLGTIGAAQQPGARAGVASFMAPIAAPGSNLQMAYTEEMRRALVDTFDVMVRNRALEAIDALKNGVLPADTTSQIQATLDLLSASGLEFSDLSAGAAAAATELSRLAGAAPQVIASQQEYSAFSAMTGAAGAGITLAGLTGNRADLYAGFAGGARPTSGVTSATNEYFNTTEALFSAQNSLARAQLAASRASIGAQWQQIALQKAQIKATVAKSMIGQVGMSIFELGAQIAEAREQARVQRLQLRAQAGQLAQQQKIATRTAAVDTNTKKLKILELQESLRVQRQKEAVELLVSALQKMLGIKDDETIGQNLGRGISRIAE